MLCDDECTITMMLMMIEIDVKITRNLAFREYTNYDFFTMIHKIPIKMVYAANHVPIYHLCMLTGWRAAPYDPQLERQEIYGYTRFTSRKR